MLDAGNTAGLEVKKQTLIVLPALLKEGTWVHEKLSKSDAPK